MKYITDQEIEDLGITPAQCVEWVRDSLIIKGECQLPTKIHVHPQGSDFITTMPCLLPKEQHQFGVKVVSRIEGRHPALKSSLTLYDSVSGEVLALMESNWITAMRTGAMAALAIKTLCNSHSKIYSFMGLGHIARAAMKCLTDITRNEHLIIRLLRYKDQAEKFKAEFEKEGNLEFQIVDDVEQLISDSDVVVSAITSADGLLVENLDMFKPGVLLVPIHTRGFQNCDTVFDKIFGDDYDHIKGFQYFYQFKSFNELGDVLLGKVIGRETDEEKIIAYNYGLALHDVYYASKIWKLI